MVDHLDPHQPSRFDHPSRHGHVIEARAWIAGRMVVEQDDRRGRAQGGFAEHVARQNDGGVEGADR